MQGTQPTGYLGIVLFLINRCRQCAVGGMLILGGTHNTDHIYAADIQHEGFIATPGAEGVAFIGKLVVQVDQDSGGGILVALVHEGNQTGQGIEVAVEIVDDVVSSLVAFLTGNTEPECIREFAGTGIPVTDHDILEMSLFVAGHNLFTVSQRSPFVGVQFYVQAFCADPAVDTAGVDAADPVVLAADRGSCIRGKVGMAAHRTQIIADRIILFIINTSFLIIVVFRLFSLYLLS